MEAVFTADALAFIVENNAVLSDIKAIFRTDMCAWRISAVHTGDGMGNFLPLYAFVQGDYPPSVLSCRQIMCLGTGHSAGETLYAAFCIQNKS
jgi:hypothetical protein